MHVVMRVPMYYRYHHHHHRHFIVIIVVIVINVRRYLAQVRGVFTCMSCWARCHLTWLMR